MSDEPLSESDPWGDFASRISQSIDWVWLEFVKQGTESAILQPLACCPDAAVWAARSLGLSDDSICRKLGAMLAGFVDVEGDASVLTGMLERERARFATNPLEANSVGEDIMFAATRWSTSSNPATRQAGVSILSHMIRDALSGTPWNTSNWAAANLWAAAGPDAPALMELLEVPEDELADQPFLLRIAQGLRAGDDQVLRRACAEPNSTKALTPQHSRYHDAEQLWQAAGRAQAAL